MKHASKVVAVSVAALSALAFSAACGFAAPMHKAVVAEPGAKVEYKGTLSILTKFGLQRLAPYFIGVAKQYEALHPGVKVSLDQETDDSVKGKTKTLVASNSLPDIYFSWTGNWGENFVRGNRAVDLTKVIGPDTAWGKTLSPGAVKAFQYNGKDYGIPLYLDGKFMGYNKEIFAKLGLSVPKTFEDLLSSCDTIRKSGMTPISLGNKEAWPVLHYVGQLLAYDVPEATLESDFIPKTAKYTDPGYLQALNEFKELADRCTDRSSINGTSYTSALQDFSNTTSAMYYQEILEFDLSAAANTTLKVKDFGFFKLPPAAGAKGDVKSIEGAPEGYMISTSSKNVPLALDFMKFVTSKKNAATLTAPPYGQPSAVIGAVTTAVASPTVAEGVTQINDASYLMPWLDTVNTPGVAAAWLTGLQAFVDGSMTAEQLMSKVRQTAAAEAAR